MIIPLEISYRDVEKTDTIDQLIREKAEKLDKICDHITSCRVAVEKPHEHIRGEKYRVRLDISVPPGQNVVVTREPGNKRKIQNPLPSVIREAFKIAERQLKELNKFRKVDTKVHPQKLAGAYIIQLFKDEGYGFIRDFEGRDIYFHKNSLINVEFDKLKVGTTVSFIEETGDKGPQASTVKIIDSSSTQTTDPDKYLNVKIVE
jgi:cold shock CspA family protein/ribosome-associated translation inhibitor RaiA